MVYSDYVKQRILFYHRSKKNGAEIVRNLAEEGYNASKVDVYKFIRRYKESGTIAREPGSGQTSKVNAEIRKLIEDQMQKNDETTIQELKQLLKKEGFDVAQSSIHQWRKYLG